MKFANGQIAEHGGELIDQSHTAMRQLAQELGFTLDNLLQAQPKGTEDFFYVNGAKYPYSQLVVDLNAHLPEAAQGRLGRELSHALEPLHAARPGVRPHVDHRLAQRDGPEAARART